MFQCPAGKRIIMSEFLKKYANNSYCSAINFPEIFIFRNLLCENRVKSIKHIVQKRT